jgi:hypothetical protein
MALLRGTCNVTMAGEIADPSIWNARSPNCLMPRILRRLALAAERDKFFFNIYPSFPQAMLISFA